MYTISRLDLETLEPSLRSAFANLVSLEFRTIYFHQPPVNLDDHLLIAVGAMLDNKPVGIILASFLPFLRLAEVQYIFVSEEHRQKGIGTQLFQAIENELKSLSCLAVLFYYQLESLDCPIFEHILKKFNWADSTPYSFQCFFDKDLFNPAWLNKPIPLPEGFEQFPWTSLKASEREQLNRQNEQNAIPVEVFPLSREELIEPVNSLGLRFNGKVVGWIIVHRLEENLIRYTSLFIDKEFQFKGPAIHLLAESIKLQKNSSIKNAVLTINLSQTSPSWRKFVERRLIPHTTSVVHTNRSWKKLV